MSEAGHRRQLGAEGLHGLGDLRERAAQHLHREATGEPGMAGFIEDARAPSVEPPAELVRLVRSARGWVCHCEIDIGAKSSARPSTCVTCRTRWRRRSLYCSAPGGRLDSPIHVSCRAVLFSRRAANAGLG
jgi:hypothetical protein